MLPVSDPCEENGNWRKCGIDSGIKGSYPSSFGDGPRVVAVNFPMLTLGSGRSQQLSDNGLETLIEVDESKLTAFRWHPVRYH